MCTSATSSGKEMLEPAKGISLVVLVNLFYCRSDFSIFSFPLLNRRVKLLIRVFYCLCSTYVAESFYRFRSFSVR